jgi:hypothetical protein
MIRPLILFLLMAANAACVSYVDDFAYLPVLRAQQGGGEFDVRVRQMLPRPYARISSGIRLLNRLHTGLRRWLHGLAVAR